MLVYSRTIAQAYYYTWSPLPKQGPAPNPQGSARKGGNSLRITPKVPTSACPPTHCQLSIRASPQGRPGDAAPARGVRVGTANRRRSALIAGGVGRETRRGHLAGVRNGAHGDPDRDQNTSLSAQRDPAGRTTKLWQTTGRGERLLPEGTTDVWEHDKFAYLGMFDEPCGDGTGELLRDSRPLPTRTPSPPHRTVSRVPRITMNTQSAVLVTLSQLLSRHPIRRRKCPFCTFASAISGSPPRQGQPATPPQVPVGSVPTVPVHLIHREVR